MANRKRDVQILLWVTPEEKKMIRKRMILSKTSNKSVYLRKMAIDGMSCQYRYSLELQGILYQSFSQLLTRILQISARHRITSFKNKTADLSVLHYEEIPDADAVRLNYRYFRLFNFSPFSICCPVDTLLDERCATEFHIRPDLQLPHNFHNCHCRSDGNFYQSAGIRASLLPVNYLLHL